MVHAASEGEPTFHSLPSLYRNIYSYVFLGLAILRFSCKLYIVYLVCQLLVPRAKTATRQRRAFSIVGPSTWNGLPLEIRLLPKNYESAFCRLLKTDLYRRGWAGGASE